MSWQSDGRGAAAGGGSHPVLGDNVPFITFFLLSWLLVRGVPPGPTSDVISLILAWAFFIPPISLN